MTIDNKCFRSPKLKEISPVGPLLLMCLLLPYPALGTELKRDPTRSYATPWEMSHLMLLSEGQPAIRPLTSPVS